MNKKIVIVSNEKFYNSDGNFSCDNIAEKSLPDELKKKFQIEIIGRRSKLKRAHNLETKKIETCSNIFSFILKMFNERKVNNSIYLVLSISPFTFLSVENFTIFNSDIISLIISFISDFLNFIFLNSSVYFSEFLLYL